MTLKEKKEKLIEILKSYGKVAIAYSGGVDSTLLARVAKEALDHNALLITISAELHSTDEIEESVEYLEDLGLEQIIEKVSVINEDFMVKNPSDRCYHCKKMIFNQIGKIASDRGINYILDGTNLDDLDDYRPGLVALKELDVKSPLLEAGLTKSDVRALSKAYGLVSWDKPAFACLASRVPYGEIITEDKLNVIAEGERFLRKLGFNQLRLRHHGDLARIEVGRDERKIFYSDNVMDALDEKMKSLGFKYVCIEVGGYKMGSLNNNEVGN